MILDMDRADELNLINDRGNEMIKIDSTKCAKSKCGFCFEVCPNYVFALGKGQEIQVRYPEQCCICGHCVAICPENALIHKEMPIERFEDLPITKIPSENMRNLLSRRSIRVFKEKPIPKELIEQLIELIMRVLQQMDKQRILLLFKTESYYQNLKKW